MMMKGFLIAALLFICVIIGIYIKAEVRSANEMATHSAAAEIWTQIKSIDKAELASQEWKILSEAEYGTVLDLLGDVDACPHCKTSEGKVADAWGERFQIAIKNGEDGTRESIVWSTGPDKIPVSDDDIVVPEVKRNELEELLQFPIRH